MKLLLVDDHPLLLEGLQYLLETNGMEVVGCAAYEDVSIIVGVHIAMTRHSEYDTEQKL